MEHFSSKSVVVGDLGHHLAGDVEIVVLDDKFLILPLTLDLIDDLVFLIIGKIWILLQSPDSILIHQMQVIQVSVFVLAHCGGIGLARGEA